MKNVFRLIAIMLPMAVIAMFFVSSCEGPRGPAGADGTDGIDGVDANETCKTCHNPSTVDRIMVEFEFSKHSYGEAQFEEAGNTTCSPCHSQQGFQYVIKNNVPATFALNATTQKYSNSYVSSASESLGEFGCATCHSSLHATYTDSTDLVLTTNAAVPMTMWKGAKTINLTQDGGRSNLCVRCHQPRPMTKANLTDKVTTDADSLRYNGDVVDYAGLATSPNTLFWDSTAGATTNVLFPSYRTHVHYGVVGAVYAGMGGVEFAGSETYQNSTHTAAASCQDCHMAAINGRAGGHTFMVQSNFNGCNASGCHTGVSSSNSAYWTTPRANIKTLLNTLATKINAAGGGTDILHSESDAEENLWAGLTTGNYDGYLNIYDPSSNPTGVWRNPNPGSTWTTDQKNTNNALPKFPSLKNVQLGAIINFQFGLRESSLGIHNYKYIHALLQNTIEAMTTAGF